MPTNEIEEFEFRARAEKEAAEKLTPKPSQEHVGMEHKPEEQAKPTLPQGMKDFFTKGEDGHEFDMREVNKSMVAGGAIGASLGAKALGGKGALVGGVGGAAIGGISGIAGELSRSMGGSPATTMAAEFTVGGGAPTAGSAIANYLHHSYSKVAMGIRAIMKVGEHDTSEATKKMVDIWRGGALSDVPQQEGIQLIKAGLDNEHQQAMAQAKQIVSDAEARAAKIPAINTQEIAKIKAQADKEASRIVINAVNNHKKLTAAAESIQRKAEAVAERHADDLQKVGTPIELSDTAAALRDKISTEKAVELKTRKDTYEESKKVVDDIVNAKESAGLQVNQTPAFKQFENELEKTLKTDLASRKELVDQYGRPITGDPKKRLTDISDPAVVAEYQKVLDAIRGRRIQVGVNPDGTPAFKQFDASKDAIDYLRRKYGDAMAGRPAEGFGAIGKTRAGYMYGKLSQIEEEFVGKEPYRKMQDAYAKHTGEIKGRFETTMGKKTTAIEEYNPELYQKDSTSLLGDYFKSKESVNKLIALTGDRKLVEESAKNYTAKILLGKEGKAVKAWMNDPKNSDWLRTFPALKKEVESYAKAVSKGESIAARAERAGKDLPAKGQAGFTAAKSEAEKLKEGARKDILERSKSHTEEEAGILKGGQDRAADIIKADKDKAAAILKSSTPDTEMTRMIMGTDPVSELKAISRYIGANPKGAEIMEKSVRQILSRSSPNTIDQVWNTRLKSALTESKMVTPKQIAKMDEDIKNIMATVRKTPKEKLSAIQRLIIGGLKGTVASELSRYFPNEVLDGQEK